MMNEVGGRKDILSKTFSVLKAMFLIKKMELLCRNPKNGPKTAYDQYTCLSLDRIKQTSSLIVFHFIQSGT